MRSEILQQLERLPPLAEARAEERSCKICGGASALFDVLDFNKVCSETMAHAAARAGVPVPYYRCGGCGLMFTDFCDDWSAAEFARFIYNQEYALIDPDYVEARPRRDAAAVLDVLDGIGPLTILDYGGGAGVMAAGLRAAGVDAECYDPFSSPARPQRRFDLITCFEVIEHSPDPRAMMADMIGFLAEGGAIVIGTLLQPPDIERIRGSWWYVGPRNGHVTIFSLEAMAELARSFGLALHVGGGWMGLTRDAPSPASATILSRIGPRTTVLDLHAPGQHPAAAPAAASDPHGWFRIEMGPGPFRWTAAARPTWTLAATLPPGRIKLRMPVINEVAPGFALRCQVAAGGATAGVSIEGGGLVAVLDTVEDAREIALVMPPLQPAPGGDTRTLGLAFRTAGD